MTAPLSRSLANQSWVEVGGCEPRHDRPMMEAGIANIVHAVLPGGGKRTWSKVPVEVAFFPAEHERSKRGVAQGKLVVCGRDVERRYVERPDSAGTDKGHARKRCGHRHSSARRLAPRRRMRSARCRSATMARVKFCAQLARILAERRQGFGQAKARRSRTWAARPLARS